MSVAVDKHLGPWSEDEYFALGETPNRVELIDGSLWVSPSPAKRHQHIAFSLARDFYDAAESVGLLMLLGVNLRLAAGRVVEPDLVVADTDDVGLTVEAAEAKLVVEVVPPSNAGMGPLFKPQLYAAAGIEWYLRVKQPDDSVELHLQRLVRGDYQLVEIARPGETLASDVPFPFRVEVASLLL